MLVYFTDFRKTKMVTRKESDRMNNLEAYKEELLKILSKEECAVIRGTNELKPCVMVNCSDCLFESGSCIEGLIDWLCEEYEKPKEYLTSEEYNFLSLFDKGYIVRAPLGTLFFCEDLSTYDPINGMLSKHNMVKLKGEYFPFLKGSWDIEELKKLPIRGENEE